MKKIMIFMIVACMPAFAAKLSCKTTGSENPAFSLEGTMDDSYKSGSEVLELKDVTAKSAEDFSKDLVSVDKTYHPRVNKNRSRFKFDLNATTGSFDGIIHGIILPKVLTDDDITKKDDKSIEFNALLMSSTDSYHDGIISYFPMTCILE